MRISYWSSDVCSSDLDYTSLVREKVGDYLAKVYDGHVSAYYPAFPEGNVARVHIIIGRQADRTPRIPSAKLEEAIRAISTPWGQRLAALSEGSSPISVNYAYQEAFQIGRASGGERVCQSV